MIFVTVGTHEQQFNRLIEEIDRIVETGLIKEEVFMQTGFSTYEPKHCKWDKVISYKEMEKKIREARIIITHGGPASFISVLQTGKIPIVVPRQYEFNEHVNNHQVEFTKMVSDKFKNIILVLNIKDLKDIINNYDEKVSKMKKNNTSNNIKFCEEFEKRIENIFDKKKES